MSTDRETLDSFFHEFAPTLLHRAREAFAEGGRGLMVVDPSKARRRQVHVNYVCQSVVATLGFSDEIQDAVKTYAPSQEAVLLVLLKDKCKLLLMTLEGVKRTYGLN